MTKAISPADVGKYKALCFPDYVFEAFNELIASNFTNGSATVKQDAVVALIVSKSDGALDRADIFRYGYLNVEEVYREQGWKVEYDKPSYCENYDAFFTFKAK